MVRMYIWRWLDLPHDVPIPFIHAVVKDGGLGIPILRLLTPRLRLSCLENFKSSFNSNDSAGATGGDLFDNIDHQVSRLRQQLQYEGRLLWSKTSEHRMCSSRLYDAVDGQELRSASLIGVQNTWVSHGTSMLSGRKFIRCIKARIKPLPARSRTSRGAPIWREDVDPDVLPWKPEPHCVTML